MGMFSFNLAFRRPAKANWEELRPVIEKKIAHFEATTTDLSEDLPGYGLMSLDPETGMQLPETAQQISLLTGDYAVTAQIVDSDFSLMRLYYNGELLEESCIGNMYDEFADFYCVDKPDTELWKPLLLDREREEELQSALQGDEAFAEDQLQALSKLTGIPIFDYNLFDTFA